jgi:hypothetical protein
MIKKRKKKTTTKELVDTIADEMNAACIGGEIYNTKVDNEHIAFRFYDGSVFEIAVHKWKEKMPKVDPRTGKEVRKL